MSGGPGYLLLFTLLLLCRFLFLFVLSEFFCYYRRPHPFLVAMFISFILLMIFLGMFGYVVFNELDMPNLRTETKPKSSSFILIVSNGIVNIAKISIKDNPADFGTKVVTTGKFVLCRDLLHIDVEIGRPFSSVLASVFHNRTFSFGFGRSVFKEQTIRFYVNVRGLITRATIPISGIRA
ncbi:hypothetical protein M9H77_27217 [Catharanthus roseus]|uniref:Uncharacterized protein n=1 Tax=Catharanthus roseus TaxID=4058 RepID=A0ACC0AE07_CATRO|nr:hypothetical protein M9H77_27217 [Catharanthus roseus]